jgi:hypothetical protein
MITFYYIGKYGRFGNQLFQYATLYSVAKETGFEAAFPIIPKTDNEYQKYILDEVFDNLTIKNKQIKTPKYQFNEKNCRFDPSIFRIADETNLMGYFQSEMYFSNYSTEIKNEFRFKNSIRDKIDIKYKGLIENEFLVSLHVRRGDYVRFQDTHPLCSVDYYSNAIKLFPKDSKFLIISDDIAWCKENLSKISDNLVFTEGNSGVEDMYLMTRCKGNIIANSSFSWWGAWLSNSDLIVAPSKWYGDKTNLDSTDIIPDRWIKL